MSGIMQLLLGGSPVVSDPYFEYTTLLLPGNGTNGAQNNTFLDSSTNNFTITRNGNTTQGTFSPFSQTGWSNYFDGSGDYLSVSAQSFSGDFTLEGWIYPTRMIDSAGSSAIFVSVSPNNQLSINSSGGSLIYYNGSTSTTATNVIQLNAWQHVAVSRSGTTTRVFVNGAIVATNSSDSGTRTFTHIGQFPDGNNYFFQGYMSNVRWATTAVYTANFTPSTTPLTAISGTSLLTCQANRFLDASSNNFTITRNGDVSVQPFSPFNPTTAYSTSAVGGSGYFDGSGDYLASPASSALALGTGDFTLECWVYATSTPSDVGIYEGRSNGNAGTVDGFTLTAFSGSVIRIYSNATLIASSGTSYVNAWCHVAVVRASGTWTLYINGVSQGTSTTSRDLTNNDALIGAGRYGTTGAATAYFPGYISNFRLVKGTAIYTTNFTPPAAPVTAITNTSLLCNFTNAGIFDATSKNDLETVGNAQISTTQSKFGGSSMYFDGTGDWLAIPATQNIVFGTADFTIEMWVYSGAQSGTGVRMMGNGAGGSWASGKYILTTTTAANPNKFTFGVNNTSPVDLLVSTTTFNDSTWRHVAITRYGNVFRLFVNGIQESTNTSSASVDNGTAVQIRIGSGGISGDSDWAGYIDDLRITKGIARYTSNFIPPSTPFLTL